MEALDVAREMLDSLCASEQPLFAATLEGDLVLWNLAATRLLGVPSSRMLGRPCWEAVGSLEGPASKRCSRDCAVLVSARRRRTPCPADATLAGRRVRVSHLALNDWAGNGVVVHLLDEAAPVAPRRPEPPACLTRREREVLELLGAGLNSRAVAAKLGISHATARTHVQRVLGKTGARTRAQAVAYGLLA